MANGVRTYDPANVTLSVGGVPISGYSEGTFIEVARTEPTWTMVSGADGLVTRGKTNNFTGTMVITLKQSSPSNDVLSAFLIADEASNLGVIPVLVKDLSGNSLFFAARAWIMQFATSTFGKDITDRQWTIQCAELDMFVGSNAES